MIVSVALSSPVALPVIVIDSGSSITSSSTGVMVNVPDRLDCPAGMVMLARS